MKLFEALLRECQVILETRASRQSLVPQVLWRHHSHPSDLAPDPIRIEHPLAGCTQRDPHQGNRLVQRLEHPGSAKRSRDKAGVPCRGLIVVLSICTAFTPESCSELLPLDLLSCEAGKTHKE